MKKMVGKINIKLSDYYVLFALLVLCIILFVIKPVFFSSSNIQNILIQSTVNGILAVGLTMAILTGGIDLSVGSVLALSGVLAGLINQKLGLENPLTPVVSIAIAVAIGAFCGWISGIVITKGKLPPFIATLGMMSIVRGLALTLTGARAIYPFCEAIKSIGGTYNKLIPVAIMIIIYMWAWWFLKYSKVGRGIYAVGGNIEAARMSGINTDRIVTTVYVISGLMAGIAGIITIGRLNTVQPTAGQGYEMDAIAAAVIGGTSMKGGEGRIMGTLIGALFIGVLRNGLSIINVTSFIQQIVIGIVIIVAVLVDSIRNHQK